jgi:hypothetical protein
MYLIDYHKKENTWYADLSGFPPSSDPSDNIRTGNFARLLDVAAGSTNTVSMYVAYKKFPSSSPIELVKEEEGGAYYYVRTFAGQPINLSVWVSQLPFIHTSPVPQVIYIRLITQCG